MHCEAQARPRAQRPELAQILSTYVGQIPHLSPHQGRVVSALAACRTAALGGHLQRCDHCGRESPLYNSCRNRHCPRCQGLEQARWVEAQAKDLLPVAYFHLVFTLPHCLNPLFLRDPSIAFDLLFHAASTTLIEVCRQNLGATPGLIAMPHSWNQTLDYHPHLHVISTGGGLSLDRQRWIGSRPNFFLPVRRLSRVFRGKLLEALELALAQQYLRLPQATGRMLLRRAAAQEFVVYSKAPLAGPEQVLRYLGRYTHRIAIGNERLLDHHADQVSFRFKDRKHGGRTKTLTLPGVEFTRRFLRHVVPQRFVRVRRFGLLANGVKSSCLARARSLLGTPVPTEPSEPKPDSWQEAYRRILGQDPLLCPACRVGHLVPVADIPPASPRSAIRSRSP